ncbi:MAG: hypothetical protein KAQ79_04920, partial [Cyclobacteriaceae bacterium]|nr:hypothetical protein [Cyclobacteriaceae bacterium]
MPRKKVLLTVTTYPLPSRSYDELVCTAGVLEDGTWIRIYPVPLSFLIGKRKSGELKSFKYNWFETDLKKRSDDFRPESYSPENYDFRDLKLLGKLDTKSNWYLRKKYCLSNVYTSINSLISDSKAPKNTSLATFKATEIIDFQVEEDERDWKPVWKEIRNQLDLFANEGNSEPSKMIPKVPYKFYYKFRDSEGKEPRLMIEDWEIGALYWKCLRSTNGDEKAALEKVRNKYYDDLAKTKDIYLF